MRRLTTRRRRRAAFTLMEVLLVVAILLILGSIAVVSFSGIMGGAEEDTTRSQLAAFTTAIKTYNAQFRQPPDELNNLIQDPGTLKKTWHPILDAKELPTDAWGRPIEYAKDGESFTLTSAGKDGSTGTADDITVTHRF